MGPGRHTDSNGLSLLVKPSGSRSWVLRAQHNGRRRDYGLGTAVIEPVNLDIPIEKRRSLSLAQAREKARMWRELVKAGFNPSAYWRAKHEATPSFKKVAEEYHREVSKAWRNGKHGDQWIATLKAYAFPEIGEVSVDQVDARMIQRVLGPIWLTKGETARRVRQRIAAVLDYAHGKGWRDSEAPLRAVNHLLGGIKQKRAGNFAAMPYRALPHFIAKLRDGDFAVGRLALQFLILTAARSGEVRKACWRDIDPEAKEWRIAPDKTKTGRLHIVPLVPDAMAVLEQIRGVFGIDPDDYVFPGLNGLMSDATMAKVLRTNSNERYTVHGFRSSFRDWAAETGFADSWAEAALAHTNPNRIESAYRRTTFFDQRRDVLMPAWAAFLNGCPTP